MMLWLGPSVLTEHFQIQVCGIFSHKKTNPQVWYFTLETDFNLVCIISGPFCVYFILVTDIVFET